MLQSDIDLLPYNTFGLSVKAPQFGKIYQAEELPIILNEVRLPVYILGGGSNILFTKDPSNTIIKNEIRGIDIISKNQNEVIIKAGAGVIWHELVMWALGNNFGGIENLSLIPGTVGAAPMQNIGAYGVEIESCFESLEAIDLETGEYLHFNHQECSFGYRDSVFKHQWKNKLCIISVTLNLTTKDHDIRQEYAALQVELDKMKVLNPTIRDISNAVIAVRQSKLPDPKDLGNAGSFFKNPEIDRESFNLIQKEHPDIPYYELENNMIKIPAGWLIEQRGWKGKRIGNTGSHAKQALVLVNYGQATGAEIYDLACSIIKDIDTHFGIKLSPEVNIL